MQKILLFAAFVLVLALATTVRADPSPYAATIVLPEVEVRSGPSAEFYATSKLHHGDAVRVVRQENNWLAIVPPSPDSFSWINASAIDQSGQTAIVKVPVASLRAGSRLMNQEPTVQRAEVPRGTQLTIIGKSEAGRDGTWVPVLPAPSEVRYIPPEAVQSGANVQQTPPPPMASSFNNPPPSSPVVANSVSTNPLLVEAEKAERAGNYGAAIRYYEELARQVSLTDHPLAVYCLNRSQYLRNAQPRTVAAAPQPRRASDTYYSNNADKRQAPPAPYVATSYPCVPAGQPIAQYCYQPEPTHTVRLVPPAGTTAAAAGPQGQWYGPGRLRRAAFRVDDKQTYALENDSGQLLMYVTAADGIDLTAYLSRPVHVYGAAGYHGELRNHYMVVTRVQ